MEIHDALSRLDPSDDSHWTEAGAPRVEAVGELLGRSVTRAEIQEAAPDFRRPSDDQDSEAPASSDPREANGELQFGAIPVATAADPYTVEGGPEDPEERLAWLEDRMTEIGAVVNRGKKALEDLNREYQKAQKLAPEKTDDEKFREDRAHYIARQNELREQRATRLRQLRESGVDLQEIAKIAAPSQLDAAMSRKTGRGGRRPQFHEDASPKKDPGTS